MNAVLEQLMSTKTIQTPDGQSLPLHSHIPAIECGIIQHWLREHRSCRVLEIGMAYGISSLFICDALADHPDSHYDIVDGFQSADWHSLGVYHLHAAGYDGRYVLHEERSQFVLPRMAEQGRTFDFALIDSWHSFDQTMIEFYYINRMLETGGILVLDDIQLPAIQKIISYILTYECYSPIAVPEEFRRDVKAKARRMLSIPEFRIVGFVKAKPDQRSWDWFQDF